MFELFLLFSLIFYCFLGLFFVDHDFYGISVYVHVKKDYCYCYFIYSLFCVKGVDDYGYSMMVNIVRSCTLFYSYYYYFSCFCGLVIYRIIYFNVFLVTTCGYFWYKMVVVFLFVLYFLDSFYAMRLNLVLFLVGIIVYLGCIPLCCVILYFS